MDSLPLPGHQLSRWQALKAALPCPPQPLAASSAQAAPPGAAHTDTAESQVAQALLAASAEAGAYLTERDAAQSRAWLADTLDGGAMSSGDCMQPLLLLRIGANGSLQLAQQAADSGLDCSDAAHVHSAAAPPTSSSGSPKRRQGRRSPDRGARAARVPGSGNGSSSTQVPDQARRLLAVAAREPLFKAPPAVASQQQRGGVGASRASRCLAATQALLDRHPGDASSASALLPGNTSYAASWGSGRSTASQVLEQAAPGPQPRTAKQLPRSSSSGGAAAAPAAACSKAAAAAAARRSMALLGELQAGLTALRRKRLFQRWQQAAADAALERARARPMAKLLGKRKGLRAWRQAAHAGAADMQREQQAAGRHGAVATQFHRLFRLHACLRAWNASAQAAAAQRQADAWEQELAAQAAQLAAKQQAAADAAAQEQRQLRAAKRVAVAQRFASLYLLHRCFARWQRQAAMAAALDRLHPPVRARPEVWQRAATGAAAPASEQLVAHKTRALLQRLAARQQPGQHEQAPATTAAAMPATAPAALQQNAPAAAQQQRQAAPAPVPVHEPVQLLRCMQPAPSVASPAQAEAAPAVPQQPATEKPDEQPAAAPGLPAEQTPADSTSQPLPAQQAQAVEAAASRAQPMVRKQSQRGAQAADTTPIVAQRVHALAAAEARRARQVQALEAQLQAALAAEQAALADMHCAFALAGRCGLRPWRALLQRRRQQWAAATDWRAEGLARAALGAWRLALTARRMQRVCCEVRAVGKLQLVAQQQRGRHALAALFGWALASVAHRHQLAARCLAAWAQGLADTRALLAAAARARAQRQQRRALVALQQHAADEAAERALLELRCEAVAARWRARWLLQRVLPAWRCEAAAAAQARAAAARRDATWAKVQVWLGELRPAAEASQAAAVRTGGFMQGLGSSERAAAAAAAAAAEPEGDWRAALPPWEDEV